MTVTYVLIGIAVIAIGIAIYLGIMQGKDKIIDEPCSISDHSLNIFLAIYLLVPFVICLFLFIMLATHYFFGWFTCLD